ncbi:hypothetical protein [Endozoicomonas euniceicola]|uniref:t-SNARE coiled-coil homology domain-containing protein n=1 Tax=Endozoicomonas euniceicola TaxID=1234143 RepID=A0ABY6GQG3_9GAMM|nr:hypothetical protein [Endozoicomonas euniceicola]UYM14993.1 hypothetical protein NX720_19270 [Endozoicomonas euniceicola]
MSATAESNEPDHTLNTLADMISILGETRSDVKVLDRKVDTLDRKVNALDHKVDALDHKVDALDHKVDALDHKVDALDHKVDALDHKVDCIQQENCERFDRIELEQAETRKDIARLELLIRQRLPEN